MSRTVPADSVVFYCRYRTIGHILGMGKLAKGSTVIYFYWNAARILCVIGSWQLTIN